MTPSSGELTAQVRSAVSDMRQTWVFKATPDALETTVAEVIAEFTIMSVKLRPLAKGERGIVSLTKPRTAALLADRVWSTSFAADREFSFGWSVEMDVRFRTLLALLHLLDTPPRPAGRPSRGLSPEDIRSFLGGLERDLAEAFARRTGAVVVPLYDSSSSRDLQYQPGNQAAIAVAIANLDIVDEESLTWDQVAEFRRDTAAAVAYRRFVHWLDTEMVGRQAAYIEDELSSRLERYDWSLRKHGIQRVIGALTTTLDVRNLLGTSSVAAAVQMIADTPLWSLCAGGGVLIGRAVLSLATAFIDRRDSELAQREISYVAEIRRLGK